MSENIYITIKEASEISGRQPRTIRYHLQKFRESSPTKKKLEESVKYEQDVYGNKILLINKAFIFELYPSIKKGVAKGNVKGGVIGNDEGSAIAMQKAQPDINEIEGLVQNRMKVMAEAHNREIDNLKQAHSEYLERLDKGAINMMNNHEAEIVRLQNTNQQMIKQLTTDKQYLQLQLNTKDETMKVLLEELKALRIERGNMNTDFIPIEQVQDQGAEIDEAEESKEEVEIKPGENEVNENIDEKIEMDIDEAIAKGITFSEWLNRKDK